MGALVGTGHPGPRALTAANALAGPTACRPQTTRPPSTWPCSSPSPDRSVPPAPRRRPLRLGASGAGPLRSAPRRCPGAAPRGCWVLGKGPGVWSAGAAAAQAGPCFWRSRPQSGGPPARVGPAQRLVTPGVAREPPSLAHRARG